MNRLSKQWFETFLDTVPQSQTTAEVAFLARQLPPPRFRHLLDLCCGPGRHASPLARLGYRVTAVDFDPEVLARAPRVTPDNPRYLVADAGDLSSLDRTFDAVVILWQSFGYFDSEGNDELLSAIADRLTERGRLVLDIYNRQFFETRQGVRRVKRGGRTVVETKVMRGRRL